MDHGRGGDPTDEIVRRAFVHEPRPLGRRTAGNEAALAQQPGGDLATEAGAVAAR
jgi:hypothetical protein